jgi:predicted N-acetyltransferase YhbS
VLVGAQSFFAPMGFTIIPEGRLELPGPVDPARFLWLQLRPGGFDRAHGLIGPPR